MSHRFVRCPHCNMPHDAAERVCPLTGHRMPPDAKISTIKESHVDAREAGARISELAPQERRPSPLSAPAHAAAPRSAPPRASAPAPTTRRVERDLIGRTIGDRYRVHGVLGEGGMGTVYDAEHLGLGRQVAIKILSPSQAKKRVAVKRFQQEARTAGAIGHPNICEVYDLGLLDDGSPYLVMEKLVGQTLADRIAREGGLPFDDVVEVISQVLSGLVAAHDKGIVHRDIKPENIFLARRLGCPPIIKLLDFGVSKMMAEFQTGDDVLDLTRTGMVMGTPYYMSPEQARGERNLDGRVDVYACGVVMYEAISGRRPFVAPNYNALLLSIINTAPRPIRDIRPATPPELEAILLRAMAKNRVDRFPSAKHMLHELTPNGVPVADPSSPRLPPPPTVEERKRAPILGGGHRTVEPRRPTVKHDAARGEATRIDTPRGTRKESKRGPSPSFHEPIDRPDSPSAMLQRRMVDAAPKVNRERASRLDLQVKRTSSTFDPPPRAPSSPLLKGTASLKRPPLPKSPPVRQKSPSIRQKSPSSPRINEHNDTAPLTIRDASPRELLLDDRSIEEEDPTELFHSDKHVAPQTNANAEPSSDRAPSRPPDTQTAPTTSTSADDWEVATIVNPPDMPSPDEVHEIAKEKPSSRRRESQPFNPEDTMKVEGNELEHLDRHVTPRRR